MIMMGPPTKQDMSSVLQLLAMEQLVLVFTHVNHEVIVSV